jgi:hypothetical protein
MEVGDLAQDPAMLAVALDGEFLFDSLKLTAA